MVVCLRVLGAAAFAALALSSFAHAGYYTCDGNARYVNGRCSDGSMAVYHADNIKPDQSITPDRGTGNNGYGNNGQGNDGYGRGTDNGRQQYDNGRRQYDNGRQQYDNRGYDRRGDDHRDRGYEDRGRRHNGGMQSGRGGAEDLFGAWSTNVAGAVWTSPSAIPGWDTLHVSPGALAGLLVIYPDGRYIWNSYGGKKGRWRYSDDPGYPIVLIDTSEHRLWNVGLDDRHPGHIYINESHGYYYYTGRRP